MCLGSYAEQACPIPIRTLQIIRLGGLSQRQCCALVLIPTTARDRRSKPVCSSTTCCALGQCREFHRTADLALRARSHGDARHIRFGPIRLGLPCWSILTALNREAFLETWSNSVEQP